MGLAEDRAALQAGAETLQEAITQAMAVVSTLETAQQQVAVAVQGYDNVELVEALGLIAMADQAQSEIAAQITQAVNNLENYIQRMS